MKKAQSLMELAARVVDSEDDRTKGLLSKAEKVIAAVGLVSGFAIADFGRSQAHVSGSLPGLVLFLASLLTLAGSLLCAFLSMRVLETKSYPSRPDLLGALDIDHADDDLLAKSIASLYLSLRDGNARINDGRASLLSASARLLIVGLVLAVATSLTRMY